MLCCFCCLAGNVYELHTPDSGQSYAYTFSVITFWDERLSFNVKACNDAHIMLQTVPGSTVDKHYEVVIGGWSNTRSVIRSSQQVNFSALFVCLFVCLTARRHRKAISAKNRSRKM